jgi:hypothetical protein
MQQPINRIVLLDFLNLFCGPMLGQGMSRTVFLNRFDTTKVIKVERDDGRFQNIIEYKIWKDCEGTVLEKYLAPIHDMSENGKILIMERCMPLPTKEEAKQGGSDIYKNLMLPDVLTDFKPSNYGILKGQVVCCDYGTSLMINHGACKMKMRRARFWDR